MKAIAHMSAWAFVAANQLGACCWPHVRRAVGVRSGGKQDRTACSNAPHWNCLAHPDVTIAACTPELPGEPAHLPGTPDHFWVAGNAAVLHAAHNAAVLHACPHPLKMAPYLSELTQVTRLSEAVPVHVAGSPFSATELGF